MPTTILKNPVNMSGTAAAPTPGAGSQPPNTLTVEGTTGQETTGTGQSAGAGADVSITAGTGGSAPNGSTNGKGGSITINPGQPGAGSGTAAAFGNVLLATAGGNVGIGPTATDLQGGNAHARYLTLSGNGLIGNADGRLELANPKSPLAVSDTVGRVTFLGPNNTGSPNTAALAQIATMAVGTGGSNGLGGQLFLYTKPDNVAGVSGGFSVDQNGSVMIANSSSLGAPFGSKLVVKGSTSNANGSALNVTNSNPNSLLFVRNDGQVGVGTTAPGSTLHIIGGVQVGTPTGGDKGAGSINIAGNIYRNGTPLLARFDQALKTIVDLTKRIEKLEASGRKTVKTSALRKAKQSTARKAPKKGQR